MLLGPVYDDKVTLAGAAVPENFKCANAEFMRRQDGVQAFGQYNAA